MNPDDAHRHTHRYQVYVEGAHVFVRDGLGRALDIGLVSDDGGTLCYQLSLEKLWGEGFLTSEKLLQDVAAKLAYASVHPLFAALPDTPGHPGDTLSPVLAVDIEEPGMDPPPGSAAP